PAREAYRIWAGRYDETVVSALEDRVVAGLSPPLAGRALLDAGCGTGRRLPPAGSGARRAVGVDLTPEMLARAALPVRGPGPRLVAGDLCALPFRAGAFDLIWCRLVVG